MNAGVSTHAFEVIKTEDMGIHPDPQPPEKWHGTRSGRENMNAKGREIVESL